MPRPCAGRWQRCRNPTRAGVRTKWRRHPHRCGGWVDSGSRADPAPGRSANRRSSGEGSHPGFPHASLASCLPGRAPAHGSVRTRAIGTQKPKQRITTLKSPPGHARGATRLFGIGWSWRYLEGSRAKIFRFSSPACVVSRSTRAAVFAWKPATCYRGRSGGIRCGGWWRGRWRSSCPRWDGPCRSRWTPSATRGCRAKRNTA